VRERKGDGESSGKKRARREKERRRECVLTGKESEVARRARKGERERG